MESTCAVAIRNCENIGASSDHAQTNIVGPFIQYSIKFSVTQLHRVASDFLVNS